MHRLSGRSRRGGRLAFLAVLLPPLALASCRTERDVQRDLARDLLTPAPLATSSPGATAAPVRSLPVRVYADEGYRGEAIHWKSSIEAQFERANQLLEPQFGIRLTVAQLRPWARTNPSRDLGSALQELTETDAGDGVEWVVGYVSSSTAVVPGSAETLGMAGYFGKHLVLRGMVMVQDRRGIERALDKLPEDEREKVMVERRLHREAVVLLHEWGHTLGGFHDRDNDSIMCPLYDRSAFRFSEAQLRILRLALARRGSADPAARATWAGEYRAEMERARGEAWDDAAVGELLAAAGRLESAPPPRAAQEPASAPAPTTAAFTPRAGAPGAAWSTGDAGALGEADLADRLGDPARAWRLAAPVAARSGAGPYLRTWACHLQRRTGARVDPHCRSVPLLPPGIAVVLFARVLAERGDRSGALASATLAENAFTGGQRPASPLAWAELSDLLAGIGACTAAERNGARAGREALAQGALATCARTRARALLPPTGSGVNPDAEPAYVETVLAARASLDQGRAGDALSAARELERSFPGAAGGPWLRCVASARDRNGDAALTACRAAERAAPGAPEPPAMLGLAAGNLGRWTEARDAFRRALERDPLDLESWSRLGVALDKLGDAAGLDDLKRRHREKFGMPLALEW